MSAESSLPSLGEVFLDDEAPRIAYTRLLSLENPRELSVTILGQVLIQAPSLEARAYVAQRINSCTDNQTLREVGESYLNHFVAYYRSIPDPLPRALTEYSEPYWVHNGHIISNVMIPMVTNHAEATNQALVRDNFRCMLSGALSYPAVMSIPWLMEQVTNVPGTRVTLTQCCHILSQYSPAPSPVCTLAQLFGGIPDQELQLSGVHNLRNIITLDSSIYPSFIDLLIWLEPVEGSENTYMIKRREEYYCENLPPTVTFSSPSASLPLPDPRYLACHAACARVMKETGAADQIQAMLEDEDLTSSSVDESSS